MVNLRLSAASISVRTLRATRLLLPVTAILLAGVSQAGAQSSHRAHISNDLQQHIDAGDATGTTVIVSGTAAQVDAIAARHGLRVRRRLTSGAVLDVPAG